MQPESTVAPDTAKSAKPARKRERTKKKRKTSPGVATVPASKVDPAQALAFVRSRIRETKDPIIKALFEREASEISERVKKAEEQRRASLNFKTKDGATIKVGDTIYRIVGGGVNYGASVEEPLVFEELLVKNIAVEERQYGESRKIATVTVVNGKGTRSLEVGQYGDRDIYSTRDAAFKSAADELGKEVADLREQFDDARHRFDTLVALRDGRELPAAPPKPKRGRRSPDSEQPSLLGEEEQS